MLLYTLGGPITIDVQKSIYFVCIDTHDWTCLESALALIEPHHFCASHYHKNSRLKSDAVALISSSEMLHYIYIFDQLNNNIRTSRSIHLTLLIVFCRPKHLAVNQQALKIWERRNKVFV
uniref:Uncharacterized protein n=1 Tax=Micrurus surinamensis TaxID=129470 RepID=A0A2D4P2R2_MICSU